jgi:hypothetical protein
MTYVVVANTNVCVDADSELPIEISVITVESGAVASHAGGLISACDALSKEYLGSSLVEATECALASGVGLDSVGAPTSGQLMDPVGSSSIVATASATSVGASTDSDAMTSSVFDRSLSYYSPGVDSGDSTKDLPNVSSMFVAIVMLVSIGRGSTAARRELSTV